MRNNFRARQRIYYRFTPDGCQAAVSNHNEAANQWKEHDDRR
ncbi:hypothetical protein [Nocardia terpenica]|nr:hypothetical protein [Nocardia terpenica]